MKIRCAPSILGLGFLSVGLTGTAFAPAASAQPAPIFQQIKSLGKPSAGGQPQSKLIMGTDGALYGTTYLGGGTDPYGGGTVFRMNPDGTAFSVVHQFDPSGAATGSNPVAGVIQGTDGVLYGTTAAGGISNRGTVFKLNRDGTGFAVLKLFDGTTTGAAPEGLTQGTDGALYGVAQFGGSANGGTVFKLNTDGTGFTVLKNLNSTTGVEPTQCTLLQGTDGALYGTARGAGGGAGTVFKLNTDGTGFTVLVQFGGNNGGSPIGGLMQGTDGALYGTASQGGGLNINDGTVYKLNTNGTGFTVLKRLNSPTTGAEPWCGLTQGTDGALYGTTTRGGSSGDGTVFKLNTDGTGFATLHNFDGTNGSVPSAPVFQGTDGKLYGTTRRGGPSGFNGGSLYKLGTDGTGFSVLKYFSETADVTEGGYPFSGMVQGTDGVLYGTEAAGGSGTGGTVFKMNVDGTGFAVLANLETSSTGELPAGGALIQGTDGALYGMAESGGAGGAGTLFKLNVDGTGLIVLKEFDESSPGGFPFGGLIQGTDGALYGTAIFGGSSGGGTVFKLNTDGSGFVVLQNFNNVATGALPYGGVIQGTDGAFYGTTSAGGMSGGGNVFRLNPDGTGFTVLKEFDDYVATGQGSYSGLMQGADGALYGTTLNGGNFGYGTVFKLNTDGTGFTVIKNLDYPDGAYPDYGGLVQRADGTIYGMAPQGGSYGLGTLFQMNPDGTDFQVIMNFGNPPAGASPEGRLTKGTDGTLYGTTLYGGDSSAGTVYRLLFGPCAGVADGTACDDGSACTQGDTCEGGNCVSGSPVTCTASDSCHDAGTCNPETGVCSNPAKADGASCNDGNACTQSDTCQAGACVGANPVVCTASDQCHDAGTCNPETGVCSNPAKSDGVSCNDGNACTQSDTCQAGTCVGANPVVCTATDQCHTAGTCSPTTGVCSNPAKPDGASCSDGSSCTQTDTCQAGVCIGGNYSWSGVVQPVNADGTSVFKLGSTIPTKFNLTGACAGNGSLVANIYFYKVSNSEGPVNEATSTSAADTGTLFRYSASGDQYIFNLGTKGLSEGSWNLGIDLHDGVGIRVVSVGLRK